MLVFQFWANGSKYGNYAPVLWKLNGQSFNDNKAFPIRSHWALEGQENWTYRIFKFSNIPKYGN